MSILPNSLAGPHAKGGKHPKSHVPVKMIAPANVDKLVGTFSAPGPASKAFLNYFTREIGIADAEATLALARDGDPNATFGNMQQTPDLTALLSLDDLRKLAEFALYIQSMDLKLHKSGHAAEFKDDSKNLNFLLSNQAERNQAWGPYSKAWAEYHDADAALKAELAKPNKPKKFNGASDDPDHPEKYVNNYTVQMLTMSRDAAYAIAHPMLIWVRDIPGELKARQQWIVEQKATIQQAYADFDTAKIKLAQFVPALMHPALTNPLNNTELLDQFLAVPTNGGKESQWPDMFLAYFLGHTLFLAEQIKRASDYADKKAANTKNAFDVQVKPDGTVVTYHTAGSDQMAKAVEDAAKKTDATAAAWKAAVDAGKTEAELAELKSAKDLAEKLYYAAVKAFDEDTAYHVETRSGVVARRGQAHGAIQQAESDEKTLADNAKETAELAAYWENEAANDLVLYNNLLKTYKDQVALAQKTLDEYGAQLAATGDEYAQVKVDDLAAQYKPKLDALYAELQDMHAQYEQAAVHAKRSVKLAGIGQAAVASVAPAIAQNEKTKDILLVLGKGVVDLSQRLVNNNARLGKTIDPKLLKIIIANDKKAEENAPGSNRKPQPKVEEKPGFPWKLLAAGIAAKLAFF